MAKMVAIPLIVGAGIAALVLMVQDLWKTFSDPTAATVFREFINNITEDIKNLINWLKEMLGISQKSTGPQAGTAERAAFRDAKVEAARGNYMAPQIPGAPISREAVVNIGTLNVDASGKESKAVADEIVNRTVEQFQAAKRGFVGGF